MIDTRDNEDIEIFLNCMARLHCDHLRKDIEQYVKSAEVADKTDSVKQMADNGQLSHLWQKNWSIF